MEWVKDFLLQEFSGWGRFERIIFPLEILFILILSITLKDNPVAIISAVFGISYTILAGKGKISCYFFGLAGTLCYSYISYKNSLFGNLALYVCYYLPMQVYGIFKWTNANANYFWLVSLAIFGNNNCVECFVGGKSKKN